MPTRAITRITPEQGELLYKKLQATIKERGIVESRFIREIAVSSNLFSTLREKRYDAYPSIRTMERIAAYYGMDYITFMQELVPAVAAEIPQGFEGASIEYTPYERFTMDTLDLIHMELVRMRELFEKIWL